MLAFRAGILAYTCPRVVQVNDMWLIMRMQRGDKNASKREFKEEKKTIHRYILHRMYRINKCGRDQESGDQLPDSKAMWGLQSMFEEVEMLSVYQRYVWQLCE